MALFVPEYDVEGRTRLQTLFVGDLPVDWDAQRVLDAASEQLEDPVCLLFLPSK